MKILDVQPTACLRRASGDVLEQQIQLTLAGDEARGPVTVHTQAAGRTVDTAIANVAAGESTVIAYLPEIEQSAQIVVEVRAGSDLLASEVRDWTPPRHWTVHVTQTSHHDAGYTDLMSNILPEHARNLQGYLEMAQTTADWEEDAQARIVIEQFWTMDHFLRTARESEADEMKRLIRSGHVEITAMFANMATELCGHETLVRTLYPAARLARKLGTTICTAEHNDIPGVVWALSDLLVDAGVKLFAPALPFFYGWGGDGYPEFWDGDALFGNGRLPGAFWWETPTGRRLLLWSNNHGTNGQRDRTFPGLAQRLAHIEQSGYQPAVMRWPVTGSQRDNSPYINFAETIREWNETWAFPHLICSTNTRFYADLIQQVPEDLPVFRGDVTGQDYPTGASSTAAATAANRVNHYAVPRAETRAVLAAGCTRYTYPAERIDAAYTQTIWHDEHTWGHHFPCGPANRAGEMEKAVYAYRGAAFAHDVENKAMAAIADAVEIEQGKVHLVVFNPSPYERTDLVSLPMREIENCGSDVKFLRGGEDPRAGLNYPFGLGDRWHLSPEPDLVAGKFNLVDVATDEETAYCIVPLGTPLAPTPYAAQRIGIGDGSRRFGLFESPAGLGKNLEFVTTVPALGYRTFRMEPAGVPVSASPSGTDLSADGTTIENAHYRIRVADTGVVESIFDKDLDRELVSGDSSYAFGRFIVRDEKGNDYGESIHVQPTANIEGIRAWVHWRGSAPGHPVLEHTITLTAGLRRVDYAVSVVKDPLPHIEAAIAFPFAMPQGRFTIDEPLHVTDPGADRLPGAFSNRLIAQDFVKLSDGEISVLWSSLDAPTISIGKFWPNRVSTAHTTCPTPGLELPPQTPDQLGGGELYSSVCNNNFGTNFSVSQDGALFFRYVLTSGAGDATPGSVAAFGQEANVPFSGIFTGHERDRALPPTAKMLAIDNPDVRFLALKHADDGRGLILRLWNPTDDAQAVSATLVGRAIEHAVRCSVTEADRDEAVATDGDTLSLEIAARDFVTLRLVTAD